MESGLSSIDAQRPQPRSPDNGGDITVLAVSATSNRRHSGILPTVRSLGIDYGRVRVGLAITDPTGTAIEPYGFVARESDEQVAEVITAIIASESIEQLVLGLPLHAHGDAGDSARHARRFAAILTKRCGLPIHEQDERHSSSEAEEILRKIGKRSPKPGDIDARAAVVILRRFLTGDQSQAES